ncbi:MAG: sigma-54 dependent transcriptional regulator, partial [Alphaproteobacteria bacterium]|jgi:two-component system, NtrC family, C4-dicarboxylate transport response regulator DctD|uniref:C4-dicarboxylate transport transcriptional regulatory protein DctD n=1 Tax=Brevundimonas mediterranea TaxID=74329 RepID=A0A6G7EFI8_9CAUL|nr:MULTISPECIES: sigma-54 dependent transcriptional regulator [Brevundimonas]MBU4195546.1 sigma-54 dependent transcriptional regulator [Alphaproteobacteria bacterium]OYX81070.1 MAG: Fis family transcriptional regulator [Brevundimonas sp. 32-68-21]EDX78859.1 Sigma-54 interaction domain family [Brevundimonas sp. BAL3]MBA4332145.1 sigma-54-dependent Fis family transcriptional regulator [Brevundimonas sp.]MBU4237971.1 sigma-54 dependent transcriptional regulator [Alphaproteobacteria bacterium]
MRPPLPQTVALIEDDADFRQALVERLTLEGLEVRAFTAAEPALKALDADFPGVVVTDLRMPGMDGRQLLTRLQALDTSLPVIMITGHGDIADAVAAMHDGAYDFVAKPFPFERLQDSLNRALEKRSLVLENRRLVAMAAEGGHELPLAGSSRAITALRATIAQIADARMDVLIEGETGVGKEAVARALHNGGRRRLAPFVAVNCGALPDGLIESELFGHELGAFAGAMRRRVGHVERAHNGSLFLDEVESMPLAVQVKMLRVLEEREIHPIGANEPRVLDLRILASAKIDLSEAARRGDFREDLYYRLNVVRLRVPPLRERREDIPLLFAHFLRRAADRHGVEPPSVTDGVRRRLLEEDWPGNIRELAHFAERVVLGLDEGSGGAEADLSLPDRMHRFEGELLRGALQTHRGDIVSVLEEMRIPRKTLYDKLQRHGLKPADFRA